MLAKIRRGQGVNVNGQAGHAGGVVDSQEGRIMSGDRAVA
jgi:hypothetical protein